MRCLFKALFVLKAVYFVACDFLDLLGLRKAGVVKKVDDFKDCDLTAISSRELVAVPRYREPVTAIYPCVWPQPLLDSSRHNPSWTLPATTPPGLFPPQLLLDSSHHNPSWTLSATMCREEPRRAGIGGKGPGGVVAGRVLSTPPGF